LTIILNHGDNKQDRENLLRWMRGNAQAVAFIEQLFYVCHLWDDLIDKDVRRTDEQINDAFWFALVELPLNPFYARHLAELHPVIISMIHEWHAANAMERGKDSDDLDIAFTLRCNILSVVSQCAYLIGGREWAAQVAVEVRRYGQRETLEKYKEEFKCQN
jgi:hypothetical protein